MVEPSGSVRLWYRTIKKQANTLCVEPKACLFLLLISICESKKPENPCVPRYPCLFPDEYPFMQCKDRKCILDHCFCDGQRNCANGEDEFECEKRECERNCFERGYSCWINGKPPMCSDNGDFYLNHCYYDCWKSCPGVNLPPASSCKWTKARCFKMNDLEVRLFGGIPACSKDGLRYPNAGHLVCDKLEPEKYSEQYFENEANNLMVDCKSLSSVTDWKNNATDSTSTPAAETDLKSRGDNNHRPAILGIIAATALCVLLQQI